MSKSHTGKANALAERLYGMLPLAHVTGLLAEVDRWTGFSNAFTHLHIGLPASDRLVVLTAILADATNMGVIRMADACTVDVSAAGLERWLASARGHYRQGLTKLVNAEHNQPLAALFGRSRRVQLG